MKCTLAGLGSWILLVPAVLAQSQRAQLAFEKADIYPSAPGVQEQGGFLPDGRLECRGTTMLKLIAVAYGVSIDRVAGGPDWLANNRFDIIAKAGSRKASPANLREMLWTLLEDRFGLVADEEEKDMPVYLLSIGPKGAKLQESPNPQSPECPTAPGPTDMNHRMCRDFGMSDLARFLPEIARNYVDRPVVDNTGLLGFFNFRLDWMNKPAYLAAQAEGAPAVSLPDALARLGLKLEPATRPVKAIAVKHVNATPTEDPAGSVEAAPRFEAAEVRPSKPDVQRRGLTALPAGEVEILGYTLRDLMTLAFEVKPDRVLGGPKWLDSDHFDVIAKSPEAMSPHAMGGMLKALIVEHFELKTHMEDRPVSVFALVALKDRPKLQPTAGGRSQCDLIVADKGRSFTCRNTTMAQLAERLPGVAQAYITLPLVDLTALPGAYDFTLTWTPKNPRSDLKGADITGQAPTPAGGLTVFEAVERQLGLRIEARKHPMPVIVVDSAADKK